MTWTPRGFRTVITWTVVVVWAGVWVAAVVASDAPPAVDSAVTFLVLPPLLFVTAARFVLRYWWRAVGARLADLDPPARLLASAVAALPDGRREWGRAMTGELAGVEGRSARWRFALSSARATLWLPPAGGLPMLAAVTGAAVTATAWVGPAVGTVVPGLRVFAVTLTALLGALTVLAVARSRRPTSHAPAATLLVAAAVVASIAVTVVLLRREPAAARYLPPVAAVCLATALAGCLWLAVAPPRWLGRGRLAPHLGAAAAVVFTGWFLLALRTENADLPLPALLALTLVLPLTPLAALVVPAFVAARSARSFRAGVQAAAWTTTALVPLTYALWLPEALRHHAMDGTLLVGERGPVGANLTDALYFCLGVFPVVGLTLALLGAGLGARARTSAPTRRRAVRRS